MDSSCNTKREGCWCRCKYMSSCGEIYEWAPVTYLQCWCLFHPTCKRLRAPGSFIDLLLLHLFAKMILLSPMTSNMLLISKYFYPLLTSQTTDSYPASHLVSMLRWWTGILDFMYLQVSSWLLISLPKSAAHPSPCMHDTMHLLEHHLSQNVDISPNDSVFLVIPHSHYK